MSRIVFLVFFALFLPLQLARSQNGAVTVTLTDGPDRDIVALLASRASAVMTELNRYNAARGNVQLPPEVAGGEGRHGQAMLVEMVREFGIRPSAPELRSSVIMLNNNTFEVRKLYVTTNAATGSKSLELVLTFDRLGHLVDARRALEEHQFNTIIEEAESLTDDFRRRQIVQYIEQFMTAYNRKDVNYIELQFSDQALIITGVRVAADTGNRGTVAARQEEEYVERYNYIRHSKTEYINRLKNHVFRVNSYINVDFSDINIYKHPEYDDVYWVQLFQKWSSSTYSDTGYLSFMIDFTNEDQPLIYVRAWQAEPFDGKLIDLNMFEIIK